MLCYLKELARLDRLGALVLWYCAFILAASGEVFGAGGINATISKAFRQQESNLGENWTVLDLNQRPLRCKRSALDQLS